ncbi:MAG: radical SAM protein, partial [Desulfobacterales bacterium]|nr:radical SAM protein [Desulfobacterales bacterium]
MLNLTKLYCGVSQPADHLRYGQGHGAPRAASERKPIVVWNITRRCNLNCIHCRASSGMTSHDTDFTTEEAKTLLDDIAEVSTPVMVLSGGEPLLRKDLFEIAKYGTGKGFRMCIATNGTLVTDDIVGKMKDAGVKICSLSLDGSTAAVHDDFRQQPGAFEAALRA